MSTRCPLCGSVATFLSLAFSRPVYQCGHCDLRFVPAEFHLTPAQERARYCHHRNTADNAGYVRFLAVAVEGLRRHADRPAATCRVLDYGSGPTPVLLEILKEEGYLAVGYDPYFGEEPQVLSEGPFDAVVSTETVEHFRDPGVEWARLVAQVRPGGILVIMTALVVPGIEFSKWHYANDPTHVAFYSESTFQLITSRWGLQVIESNGKNLVVLRKSFPGPKASG